MSKQLGEIIKSYRLQRNLSVRGLASLMFLSPSTISRWETGSREPDLDTIFLIADRLRINPSLLMSAKTEHEVDRKINIMVVAADAPRPKNLIETIKKMLPDHCVLGFDNPKDALEFAESTICDIAFIDLTITRDKGLEFAKKLTELYPPTNIIFLSDETGYMEAAWRIHASGYLPEKPDKTAIKDELAHLRYPVWGLDLIPPLHS